MRSRGVDFPPFGNNDIISRRGIRDTFAQRANITSHLDVRELDMSGVQDLQKNICLWCELTMGGCRAWIACIVGNFAVEAPTYLM